MLQTIRAYESKLTHLTNDGETTICGRTLANFELDYHYAEDPLNGWRNCPRCEDKTHGGFSQALKDKIERLRVAAVEKKIEEEQRRLTYQKNKSDHEMLANLIKGAIFDAFPNEHFSTIQLATDENHASGSLLEFQIGVHKIKVSGLF